MTVVKKFSEYKAISVMIPENYAYIVVDENEFNRIIKENFNKKSKAIVYRLNGFKFIVDAKESVLIQLGSIVNHEIDNLYI
jgi:hypothetical protein